MHRLISLFAFASLVLLPDPAGAQEAGYPTYLPIQEFGSTGSLNLSVAPVLTSEQLAEFEAAVSAMERFPPYLYSGCHDRAHAAYLLLPQALRPNVSKIWVISPSRFTAAIPGTIGLDSVDAASRRVAWGYHVALSVNTGNGVRIFDPALSPGGTITREQWFALMTIPRLAIWTETDADLYTFNYSTVDPQARNGNQVWTGNANYYDVLVAADRIIPENIARDAIGLDAMNGDACPAINRLGADPEALLRLLLAGPSTAPPECAPSFAKFQAERNRWKERLT